MLNRMDGTTHSKRRASLDHFRGLAVFLMILVNSLADYTKVPALLKHAPWNGYTFADLVAPLFLFAMGIAYMISFRKRLALYGIKRTVFHFIKRYTILLLFGLVGIFMVYRRFDWGVLQMLGAVGIFSLPFAFFKPFAGLAVSFILLIFYQISISFLNMEAAVSALDMGGPFAVLSWSFILITAAALGRWIKGKDSGEVKKIFIPAGIILTLFGLFLSFIFPLNKHLVSSSYILLSLGLSVIIYLFLYVLMDDLGIRINIIESFGKNPLVLYIIGSVLIVIENAIIPETALLIFPVSGTLAILAICSGLAEILALKKIYIKL
ncbi:MAG: DUF1624 domain-containing protein [Spirochaetes bacterium]|nr:DUF1624 domain-containing protein [Spirochaetota bacterium]